MFVRELGILGRHGYSNGLKKEGDSQVEMGDELWSLTHSTPPISSVKILTAVKVTNIHLGALK